MPNRALLFIFDSVQKKPAGFLQHFISPCCSITDYNTRAVGSEETPGIYVNK